MAFPETVLPLVVELLLDGAWVGVTSDVYRRDMVNITRGRADENAQLDRSACSLTLNNRDGVYSPRNPTGTYYGILGRNTPIRVSLEGPDVYLDVPGTAGAQATAPDAAALGITGDIDVRIDIRAHTWQSAGLDLCGKYETTGNQRSWLFGTDEGLLVWGWSTSGTAASTTFVESTELLPVPVDGRMAVRVTHDVNNGSGGNTVTFYTSDSIGGSWTQLGDPVVNSGTTSIFDSTAVLEVGDVIDLSDAPVGGQVLAFQLRNSSGTVVANPDFTAQTVGATSFADTASSPNTWTLQGGSTLSNRIWRFHGEVSSWPARWDLTGTDVFTPVEASGVLRRLSQGSSSLGSALYRGRLLDTDGLVAYWPMEDVEGSTSLAPALDHGPLSIIGAPELASDESFVASGPLPVLNDAELRGSVPAYDNSLEWAQVRFLLSVPAAGDGDNQAVLTFYTTGSVGRWEVHYGTGGTLGLRAYDGGGTLLFDTGDQAFGLNGAPVMVSVEVAQSGSDVGYTLSTLEPGASSGLTSSGTLAANTLGRIGGLIVNPSGGLTGTAVGHLSVQNTVTTLFDLGPQLDAWKGEKAGRRVERLAREEDLAFRAVGDLDDTVRLGAQRPGTLVELIRQAADADLGMLYEPRSVLGLGYRTRSSLYNQDAVLALDYEAHELAEAPSPVDDDQQIVNDVTVTREGGSSARAVQETGTLSVEEPPDGVGRYPSETTISVEYDLDLFEQAGWRLHLGTTDEARYPQLALNLAHTSIAGDTGMTAAARDLDVGDRVTVANPPAWLPPESISQIVQGYSEELGNYEHSLRLNCSPASPYEVAVYDVQGRYESYGTTTNEALDSTETGVDITTPVGPLWSTAASGFDVMIGGERMTVTAVGSPTGTAQTLTVVRSVNGVTKSHASGAEVRMFEPAIYAL
jgi:hypothetical protein